MTFRHRDDEFYPGQPVEWDALLGSTASGQFMWWGGDGDGPKPIVRTAGGQCFLISKCQNLRPVDREPRVGDIVAWTSDDGVACRGVIVAPHFAPRMWRVAAEPDRAMVRNEAIVLADAMTFAASAAP